MYLEESSWHCPCNSRLCDNHLKHCIVCNNWLICCQCFCYFQESLWWWWLCLVLPSSTSMHWSFLRSIVSGFGMRKLGATAAPYTSALCPLSTTGWWKGHIRWFFTPNLPKPLDKNSHMQLSHNANINSGDLVSGYTYKKEDNWFVGRIFLVMFHFWDMLLL